jgi:putative sterol carrier protein
MSLTFDPQGAGDLDATIQFVVGAPQKGNYFFEIAGGVCTFHVGMAAAPSLTITTPSDVWLKIASGQLNPQQALMQGMYKANGDFSLLLRMGTLFKASTDVLVDAPRDQRPGGPIALSGMAWMTVAFAPTILYWILFNLPVNPWISVGLPLLLSLVIVGYRLIYDRPTWLEVGICLSFVFVAGLLLFQVSGLAHWGSVFASLVMGGIWLSSLVFAETPVSAEYSKWSVVTALWRLSLFIHPNAVISLMWGWQFIAAGALGITALWFPNVRVPLIIAQYGLIVPASWFTAWYQKGIRRRRIADVDKTMAQIRLLAAIGLGIVFIMMVLIWVWF